MGTWQASRPRPSMLARSRRGLRQAVPLLVWVGAVAALFQLAALAPPALQLPGLVDANDCTITAPAGGNVVAVAVQLHQPVEAGAVVLRLDDSDVRAPMRGVVSSIDVAAGERVPAGRALLTIVDPQARRILAWVPDVVRRRLAPAAAVHVRRADASLLGATSIVSISPTAVRLPARLWRDPQREEWGYEVVLAAIGGEVPGERVQLALH